MYNKSLHLTFFRCRSKMQVNSNVSDQNMNKTLKSTIITVITVSFGIVIGGFFVFYFLGNINKQWVTDWGYNTSVYNTSNNLRLLYLLRNSEYENARNHIERDIDSNIVLLGSLLNEETNLTVEQKENIINKLESYKNYRGKYPKVYQNKEIENQINEILNKIN